MSARAPAGRGRARAVFAAATPMMWRGGQIFLLALLFRVQAWVLSPGATLYGILKVDILNIMGPAIAGAALVWGLVARPVPRMLALAGAASVFGLLTPIVRSSVGLAALPDPIEWYLRPWAGRTTFTFFPWAGFVFVGAAVGVLLDRARDASDEARLNLGFGLAGAAIAAAAFGASYLPSPYASSYFWTSSPCFFFLRAGMLVLFLALAYLWGQRPMAPGRARWRDSDSTSRATPRSLFHALARDLRAFGDGSPFQQFGRTSLFIYWIHVELVYGILSYPLHANLTLPQACAAFVLFTLAMLYLSVWKTRVANRRRDRDSDQTPAVGFAPISAA